MVIADNKKKDGEEDDEGMHAHLHYNKNCLMKALTHCADKCMKQEIQIISVN